MKKTTVKEVTKWLKSLEEFRYRKVPGVDARRIASFVNNGINETDLPSSLQKKWDKAKYSREKHLANKFIQQKINTLKKHIKKKLKMQFQLNILCPIWVSYHTTPWKQLTKCSTSGLVTQTFQ